ncbi:MAG TPA: cob(I)yrinic acid a,c-diamide adenosyltransferase [Anaerolineales bacterium]|nr:cob(I)yrinic acid a,c-diamide adenosyltransferase [Anaerolineales bacterium]
MSPIYTRTGDQGETALGGGWRVSKGHLRVEAYGTVDELNAHVGLAIALGMPPTLASKLSIIQNELFQVGSDLCFLESDPQKAQMPQITKEHVKRLENWLDALSSEIPALRNFILPGGVATAAQLQVARTVCRRAERIVATLASHEEIGSFVLPYLNRLSDLLFVMARHENHQHGISEPQWNAHT